MAEEFVTIGSVGPFGFDSSIFHGVHTTGQIRVETAPADDEEVMRKMDGDLMDVRGLQSFEIPAGAFTPTMTDGAMFQQLEMSGNLNNFTVLEFSNTGGITKAHFNFVFPKKWDGGTIKFQVHWTYNDTATDSARFGLAAVATGDGDSLDVAYGTPQTVDDNGLGTAYDRHITALSAAITIAGSPADGDGIQLEFYRDSGNDTLAVSVYVLSVIIFYDVESGTDE